MSTSTKTTTLILNQGNNITPPTTTSGFANVLTLRLSGPIPLKGAEIALTNLFCYYSWVNISSAYGNNTIGYIFSGVTYNLVLPDGIYTIDDINSYLHLDMYNRSLYMLDPTGLPFYFLSLSANLNYYSVTLTVYTLSSATVASFGLTQPPTPIVLGGNCPQLLFPVTSVAAAAGGAQIAGVTSMARVLGFASSPSSTTLFPIVTTASIQINGTFIPQIAMINNINVICNLVNSNLVSSAYASVIHSFSPTVSAGQQINSQPYNLVFYPVNDGNYSEIKLSLYDDYFQPLPIRDPAISAVVVIRQSVFSRTS